MTVSTQVRRSRVHVTGAASAAVRPVLESSRRPARVLAAFPTGVYLEVRTDLEPSVIAVITGEATRLPNSVLLATRLPHVTVGDEATVGDRSVELGRLTLSVRRWWDPAPPPGRTDLARLARAATVLGDPPGAGLAGNDAVDLLASSCAKGWLLGAVTAAEQLVGLGPGLTPSGDDVLAGLLVTLRQLGAAAGVERAVWLAGWLAAAVTFDAGTRTTPISATLLHCAARGEASPEVSAVLRAVAAGQGLEPALRRLHRLGHTSGADLAQGIAIGVSAVLSLGGSR
ncbi:DUF2877 domain-containing protein [Nonomuraea jiangxiensis]|uniref:DUF2877 domain-containing protein n=1 Tax=Nonomuraea jiangxiensis TaxID=633440 RepID=A0A1G8CCH5_9ACTN|nr:DUF2877 domain-containing protein [Nonomuraea jiangxiensis]SDH43196.1 Protein of unknown function [Nonomuraea jiangxiensis]